jgi:hypothetical protein
VNLGDALASRFDAGGASFTHRTSIGAPSASIDRSNAQKRILLALCILGAQLEPGPGCSDDPSVTSAQPIRSQVLRGFTTLAFMPA